MGGLVPQERGSFYGLDGRLRITDWRWAGSAIESPTWKRAVEEYRYDALRRRVWTQATKTCIPLSYPGYVQAECLTSLVRRTVWDGVEELGEIQMPLAQAETDGSFTPLNLVNGTTGIEGDPNGYLGQVVYVNARGLDQPLALTRLNYVHRQDPLSGTDYPPITMPPLTVAPFWTAQGDALVGVFTSGVAFTPPGDTPWNVAPGAGRLCNTLGQKCVGVPWLIFWLAYDRQLALWDNWWGTLLQQKRDKSGLEYKRNRYYDPATGRFTQEDPIGLAGGLNLYGFAEGDPVNSSDPFGLAPCRIRGNCTQSDTGEDEAQNYHERTQASIEETLVDPSILVGAVAKLGGRVLGRVLGAAAARQASRIGTAKVSELTLTHGLRLSRRRMAELSADIAENGIREPIKYVEHNGARYVVDGHHRLAAARRLGINEVPVQQVQLPFRGYRTVDDLLHFEP